MKRGLNSRHQNATTRKVSIRGFVISWLTCVALVSAATGGLDPAALLKPLSDSWPSYSGDYTGRRYSSLTHLNQSNVKNLSLAWAARVVPGPAGARTMVGGEGTGEVTVGGATTVKGAILMVNDVLYVTA